MFAGDANYHIGEDYRRCCTSIAWIGEGLAARIMHAEKLWDHDAFFDYVDRWMTEPDAGNVASIKAATGLDYSADWEREGQAWDAFVEDMWTAYRNNLPPTGVALAQGEPDGFRLYQNYPNPFNPATVIRYAIPGAWGLGLGTSYVRLVVYDLLGREVAVLVNEQKAPGNYVVTFSAKSASAPGGNAAGLAGGVYFYRLTAGNFVQTHKMVLAR
jgi:hypothetical protein